MHKDAIPYFFIAFALYILLKCLSICTSISLTANMLYLSISVSLLASNIPRVVDLPLHFAYPVKCIEYFTLLIALGCFIILCIHHIL